jgi:excisionase family DNA binding protein
MAKKILTVSELAEHLSVHRITIYRLLKGGTLPGFKIGRVWRFDLDEIATWMASGKAERELTASDGNLADGQHDGVVNGERAATLPSSNRRFPKATPTGGPRH